MFLICSIDRILFRFDEEVLAMASLSAAQRDYPDAFLAEIMIPSFVGRGAAIPGELDRAIDAWNAMTERVNIHIDKVQNRARLVAPYRKWKKAIGKRDYLLEQLIADVEVQPYIWPTIRFPWLFRVKDGDFNSDKIHARAFGKANGNGQITERAFLELSRRATTWIRECGNLYSGDGSFAEAFERNVGINSARYYELQKRFNGGAPS